MSKNQNHQSVPVPSFPLGGIKITARARRARRTRRLAWTSVREKMIGFLLKLAGFGVGYLYPTYSALKLLDRKVIGPEDVTLWLTYFIVAYSLFIAETIGLVSW
jgi:hypothetical protein